MSAGGNFIPAIAYFPSKKIEKKSSEMKLHQVRSSATLWTAGLQFHCSVNGLHLLKKRASDGSIILIFDRYFYHTTNVEIIEMTCLEHVSLVCLPSKSWKKWDEREAKKCRRKLSVTLQEAGPSKLKKSKTSKTPRKSNECPKGT